jgi:hypothetical protein
MNDAPDSDYNRARADRISDRQDERVDRLTEAVAQQEKSLAVHLTECMASERQTRSAIADLRRLVLFLALAESIWAGVLKTKLGGELLNLLGLL